MTEHMIAEMQIAKAYRDEGDQLRKQATAELNEARELRDQAARGRRDIAEAEAAITRRELRLAQLNEAKLVEREKAAAKALADAKALLATYNNDKHAAALALKAIDERERAEREQSAAQRALS
jgi:hypothetical protein